MFLYKNTYTYPNKSLDTNSIVPLHIIRLNKLFHNSSLLLHPLFSLSYSCFMDDLFSLSCEDGLHLLSN